MRSNSQGRRRSTVRVAAPVRWWMLLICLLLGGRLVADGLADRLASSNPGLASAIAPWHVPTRVSQVRLDLQGDANAPEDIIRQVGDILRADPLAPSAFTLLAQAREAQGNPAAALAAWGWAARTWQRDGVAQAVLLERDLVAGDVDPALDRLDILLRSDPETGFWLLRRLTPLLSEARFLDALTRRLEAAPPWRLISLRELAQRAPALDPVLGLYRRLQRGSSPPTEEEMRPLLVRMVSEGRHEEAYVSWLESGQRDQRLPGEWLYNAQFQAAVSQLPFDWTFEATPGAFMQVDRSGPRRRLTVDFFGSRNAFQNVSQWLLLPPGTYVLSGLEMAQGLVSDRGVRWRLACADDLAGELAVTPPLTGTVDWRPFSVSFVVVPRCRAQRLVLEVPARVVLERVISGRAAFGQLSLRALAVPFGKS
jgi:hypothetical protein